MFVKVNINLLRPYLNKRVDNTNFITRPQALVAPAYEGPDFCSAKFRRNFWKISFSKLFKFLSYYFFLVLTKLYLTFSLMYIRFGHSFKFVPVSYK